MLNSSALFFLIVLLNPLLQKRKPYSFLQPDDNMWITSSSLHSHKERRSSAIGSQIRRWPIKGMDGDWINERYAQ